MTKVSKLKYSKLSIRVHGKTSVGKSTFINKLLNNNLMYTSKKKSTKLISFIKHGKNSNLTLYDNKKQNMNAFNVDSKYKTKNYTTDLSYLAKKLKIESESIYLYDYPGIEKEINPKDSLFDHTIKYNTINFYIADLANLSDASVKKDIGIMSEKCSRLVVLINKYDDMDEDDDIREETELIEEYKDIYKFKAYHFISLRDNVGIDKIENEMIDTVRNILFIEAKILSDQKVPVLILNKHLQQLKKDYESNKFISNGSKALLIGAGIGVVVIVVTGAIVATVVTGGLAGGPILGALAAFGPGGVLGGIITIGGVSTGVGTVVGGTSAIITKTAFTVHDNNVHPTSKNITEVMIITDKVNKEAIEKYIEFDYGDIRKEIRLSEYYNKSYKDYKFILVDGSYFLVHGNFEKNMIIKDDDIKIYQMIFNK
jgi:GTPase Era involved in 16S rRNA processing